MNPSGAPERRTKSTKVQDRPGQVRPRALKDRLKRMSVSRKLLFLTLLVASLGILSGGTVLLLLHQRLVREDGERSALALASAAAEYCEGPLVFDDREGGAEVLGKLESNPQIHGATLYDAEGRVFARFEAAGQTVPIVREFAPGVHSQGHYLFAVHQVQHGKHTVGTLVVATSTLGVEQKAYQETVFTLLLCAGLIALCGLLAFRLQRFVTAPLVQLAETMRGVDQHNKLPAPVEPPTSDEIGTLYEGFNTMVAQLQAREQERDRSEAQLRAVLEALPDRVFLIHSDGRLADVLAQDATPATLPIDGVSGKTLEDVMPADVADALLAMVRDTLETREPQRLEYAIQDESGTLSFEAISSVVADAVGSSEPRVLIISRDVSERRELEQQLRHAAKMDAIGRLAGGVAHDFNNLLTGIIGYADLIRRLNDSRSQAFAEAILGASSRATELVRQLLAFSRRSEPSFEPTRVEPLLENVANILRRTVDRRIDVRVDAETCSAVRADPTLLETAILNLAVNARDAMPEGGNLTLRVRPVDVAEGEQGPDGIPLTAGPYVEVSVVDSGAGIEPSLRSRIFEPFFTTKPTGKGTGLGLAAVYGTVRSHGGAIFVESTTGKGTTFRIMLPSLGTMLLSPRPAVPSIATGEGHILVVDDEDFVRQTAARFLRDMGYDVTEAVDGQDALDVFDREGSGLDLVVLDLVMPRMHGMDVLEALRQRAPGLPVLLMSGHAVGAKVDEARRNADAFLQKPFRPADLVTTVQRLLALRRVDLPHPTTPQLPSDERRGTKRWSSGRMDS
jgi:PAS domain S-box-containing protein